MKQGRLSISGMSCASCAATLAGKLLAHPAIAIALSSVSAVANSMLLKRPGRTL